MVRTGPLARLDVRIWIEVQGGADLVAVKTAILKEPRLLCTLTLGAWQIRTKLAPADLAGQLLPIRGPGTDLLLDLRIGNALLPELGADAHRTFTAPSPVVDIAGGKTLVRDQLLVT